MNWENYGSDREETVQLAPSTENEITAELQAIASKRRRERLALGITALLSAAVVSGVVLHSSRRSAISETTLAQTGAQVSAFRSKVTNFGIEEGKTIKCGEDDDALYRMSNNERHYYPSTEIAAAWDSDWQNPVVADCTDIPQGADMSFPNDTTDTPATDAAWNPATPSDPPVSGPYDLIDEETEESGSEVSEPDASESESSAPDTAGPEYSEPEYSQPESMGSEGANPEHAEPDYSEPEYPELEPLGLPEPTPTKPKHWKAEYTEGTEPKASAPDTTSLDATDPQASKPQDIESMKDPLWQPNEPTKATQWEPEEPAGSTEWEPKDPSESPLWEPKESAELKPWEAKEPVEPMKWEPKEPFQYEPMKPIEPKTWDSVSNTFKPLQYEPKTWGSKATAEPNLWEPKEPAELKPWESKTPARTFGEPAHEQQSAESVPFFKPVPEPKSTESTSFWQPPLEQKPAEYAPQLSWPAAPPSNTYQIGNTLQYPLSNDYQNGNTPQYPPSNNFQNGMNNNAPPVVGKELTPAEMKKALEDQVKNLHSHPPGGK